MTHVCEFPTAVRLREVGTLAEIIDLHDPDGGFDLLEEIATPAPNQRQARIKSARAHGSYGIGVRLNDDGLLVVRVSIEGSTWAETTARAVAMVEALRSANTFYVETELSGVVTRWYSDAPVDVLPEPIDVTARANNLQQYELRFLVQPNPTITIV